MTTIDFPTLVSEELAGPFTAKGFRAVTLGETRQRLVSPAGGIFEVAVDPRDGVVLDYLHRGRKGDWSLYPLGLYLAKRADKAKLARTAPPQGALDETRLRAELSQLRTLIEAVGQDLLADDRRWLADYPWPATPLPGEMGRDLDQFLERSA